MQKKKPSPEMKLPRKSKDLPASQGMLQLVRSELKSDIQGLRSEMQSGFNRIESQIARVATIVEEQNTRNQVAFEALTGLYHRQDRIEMRFGESENIIQGLAARSRR